MRTKTIAASSTSNPVVVNGKSAIHHGRGASSPAGLGAGQDWAQATRTRRERNSQISKTLGPRTIFGWVLIYWSERR